MPERPCLEPGCPEFAAPKRRGRCALHARGRERETHRNKSFYAKAKWQNTRKRYLFDHPLCECGCGRLAEDVHHKQALEQGGDPWAMDNLEALTHVCHAKLTRREQMA